MSSVNLLLVFSSNLILLDPFLLLWQSLKKIQSCRSLDLSLSPKSKVTVVSLFFFCFVTACVMERISEQNFWCNYFYRVFLIKQSSQLATLSAGNVAEGWATYVFTFNNCFKQMQRSHFKNALWKKRNVSLHVCLGIVLIFFLLIPFLQHLHCGTQQ